MTTKTDLVAKMQNGTDVEGADRPPNVFDLISRNEPQFMRALNDEAGAKRLTRILQTEIRRNPRLGECTTLSLLGASMQCAQHNLEPGPLGHAYLVPIWNGKLKAFEVEWWLGYQGMMELARRSGRIRSLEGDDVCPNDTFRVVKGSNADFVHEINYKLGRGGEPYAYYAYAELDEGEQPPLVLTPDEVNAFRERSPSWRWAEHGDKRKGGGKKDSAWHTDYRAMALKTCVRRLFTWLPMSIETQDAMAGDEQVLLVSPDEPERGPAPRERDVTEVSELSAGASDPFDGLDGGPQATTATPAAGDDGSDSDGSPNKGQGAATPEGGRSEPEPAATNPPETDTPVTHEELRASITVHKSRDVTVPKAMKAVQSQFPNEDLATLEAVVADPQALDWLLGWIERGGKG